MRRYLSRIADKQLDRKLESFGAVLMVGPPGCGKTATAMQRAGSSVGFGDGDRREAYLSVAEDMPSKLLIGERPRLLDEWQDAPKIWGAVRKSVDEEDETGMYILTGLPQTYVDTPHTGTMRISTLRMHPMSLFESGESNGSVSLRDLFDGREFAGCESQLSADGLISALCRGGWPASISDRSTGSDVARELFERICNMDIQNVDGIGRNPDTAAATLRSYSRNLCTSAEKKAMLSDVNSEVPISAPTLDSYIEALKALSVIEDIPAWAPPIRSKTAVRMTPKRNLADPSIAVTALGLSPECFETDFRMLGPLFGCLCIRDLRVYSSELRGTLSHYRDRYGLEADAVLHLRDGRYALIGFSMWASGVERASRSLDRIGALIGEYNSKEDCIPMRMPDLRIVITGTQYGYRRPDGVYVIPIGCLRD